MMKSGTRAVKHKDVSHLLPLALVAVDLKPEHGASKFLHPPH
ncbi:hypothetical protein [Thermococcus sp.]|nr:hypothetical protein [Thermococcus sp.]